MMKTKPTHILYKWNVWVFLLLLAITGCQEHSPIADRLQQAETVMNEHPDSALNILKDISGSDLRIKEHRARHALLYSQALDKNYIDLTNDSLINIAVDYYKDKDDVKSKFHAYYYLGRIYTNANKLTQATLAYMEAEQLVDELNDNYLAGLLYNQLGDIYEEYYDFPKALESYQYSTEYYHKANKPLHKLYGMLSQSAVYKSMGKDTDSFHLLYNILMEAKETNNATVIGHCLADLIMLCLKMNKQEEAISFYNDLTNNYSIDQMSSPFYANLSLLMAKEKNWEKSRSYMDQAWKRASTQSDSIILYKVSAQTAHLNFSYLEAYSNLEEFIAQQNNRTREVLQQPVLTAQRDFLNQELEHKEYKLKMEKYIRILGFTILLFILAISIAILKRKFQKNLKVKLEEHDSVHKEKMKELQKEALQREDSLRSYAAKLEANATLSTQDINRLNRELENSKTHIEEARVFLEQTNQEMESLRVDKHDSLIRINKSLKNHFKQIENTYQVLQVNYKNTENRDKAIEEYILNTTHEFYGSKKADRNLEKFINELYGNAMKHFRKEIKLPSEDHYRLVCLLLAGVSINFISSLSGETTNAIYKRREKIREIIKSSDSPNKELYLLI